MNIEQIEFYLTRGDILGAIKKTDSNEYMGWISIRKRKPNKQIERVFTEVDRPDLIAEEQQKRERPYQISICELKKLAYENDEKLPEASDYRVDETLNFSLLKDALSFIEKYDIFSDDIKWMADVPSL